MGRCRFRPRRRRPPRQRPPRRRHLFSLVRPNSSANRQVPFCENVVGPDLCCCLRCAGQNGTARDDRRGMRIQRRATDRPCARPSALVIAIIPDSACALGYVAACETLGPVLGPPPASRPVVPRGTRPAPTGSHAEQRCPAPSSLTLASSVGRRSVSPGTAQPTGAAATGPVRAQRTPPSHARAALGPAGGSVVGSGRTHVWTHVSALQGRNPEGTRQAGRACHRDEGRNVAASDRPATRQQRRTASGLWTDIGPGHLRLGSGRRAAPTLGTWRSRCSMTCPRPNTCSLDPTAAMGAGRSLFTQHSLSGAPALAPPSARESHAGGGSPSVPPPARALSLPLSGSPGRPRRRRPRRHRTTSPHREAACGRMPRCHRPSPNATPQNGRHAASAGR